MYNRTCYILTLKNFPAALVTFVTFAGVRGSASIQRISRPSRSSPSSLVPSTLSTFVADITYRRFFILLAYGDTISRKFNSRFASFTPGPGDRGPGDRRYTTRFRLDSSHVVRGNRKSFTGHDELFLSRRRKIAGNFPMTRWADCMCARSSHRHTRFVNVRRYVYVRECVCATIHTHWSRQSRWRGTKDQIAEWMRESIGSSRASKERVKVCKSEKKD